MEKEYMDFQFDAEPLNEVYRSTQDLMNEMKTILIHQP